MGDQHVKNKPDGEQMRVSMKRLLRDVRAMEHMLNEGMFESDIRRIGAEQELFLLDEDYQPAPLALKILEHINDSAYTTELGLFNLEYNLPPQVFGNDCLSTMENQLITMLARVKEAAQLEHGKVLMTGILPTIQKSDLGPHSMTPNPRYHALNDAMTKLRGQDYEFYIKGIDEFIVKHNSVMLEACNTSFQVHFQVGPEEFAKLYNIAQLLAAPCIAVAANSPLLFGKRLWHETRVALLEQSIDTRASQHHMRELKPRVTFGTQWVKESVLEIFQEDISRFRLLFGADVDEDPFEAIEAGRPPALRAFCLHNSTVYRWNRPCYGIFEGKPHLRIENRVLPSGPTHIDEVANAAFWFGLMGGVVNEYGDITSMMDFDDAKHNFFAAARLGLDAPLTWLDGKSRQAHELILKELLPLAREGLAHKNIVSDDIDRYMNVIEERVRHKQNGSSWMLQSFANLKSTRGIGEKMTLITAANDRHQELEIPVHQWPLASTSDTTKWQSNYQRVEQYMSTDLFTVNEDELIDLVASVMDWQHLRHVPVEDNEHHLVGLVTHRSLLRLMAEGKLNSDAESVPVSSIMQKNVITVAPETRTIDAITLMRHHSISCLPVVKDERLVGIVTERDFMDIARVLLEEKLSNHSA